MGAPVLFARARESALMLARADALLHSPAGEAPEVEGPGVRVVLESSLFFARVGQSRQRLAKYDPAQKRDDEGKWAAFGGIPAFAKEHLFADGTVKAKVDKGGLQLTLANNAGGVGKSGGLDSDARWELARRLELAAEWNPREDGYPRGGDGPEMAVNSVATYPVDGDGDSLPTGFAEVSHDGTGNIELELLDSDAKVKLSRAEAKQLADSVRRSSGVSRISLPSGLMDVCPTDDMRIGLRLNAADGSVKELAFDGKSWTRLRRAMSVVGDGYDEFEDFVATGEDDNGNVVYPDVDSLDIDTNMGRLRVSREGPTASYTEGDPNYLASGPTTVAAVDGSWSFTMAGEYKADESVDAFQAVEAYAGYEKWPGIENAAPRLPQAVVWRPLMAGVKLLPRAEFTESKHKRDRKGRFAEKNAAAVLSELDELMDKLAGLKKHMSEDERDDFDGAMDYLKDLRRSRKKSIDAGPSEYASFESLQYGTEVELSTSTGEGHVAAEWPDGDMTMSVAEAEEIAGFLDEFLVDDRVSIFGGDSEKAIADRTTTSGEFKVLLWENGTIEVGLAGEVPGPEDGNTNLIFDPADDFADAHAFADALEELAETASQGPVTNTAVVLPHAKFDPSQKRDEKGRWADELGGIGGVDILDPDAYLRTYGDVADDRTVNLREDLDIAGRFFENGQIHIALDLADGHTQVLEDLDDVDALRQLADDLEEIADADVSDYGDDDFANVVEDRDSGRHSFRIGKYGSGDMQFALTDSDEYLDMSEDDARAFADKLRELADSWDEEFLEEDADEA